ncbi:hypothetical protein OG992_28270 [Micromonospora sp. NBC_00362]|uniref:hypothetical protein n=1 Tax=Micromonospora sp. NBC_00362 TaxID=2975975 RepID=UPI00225316EC|nr:hypothetical protein [Micromonospora sp. NBC_00362]MCX5121079.1 hypothetical protein [Micromonospora sp. NBC_00362]
MAAEHVVIDLDEHGPEPAQRSGSIHGNIANKRKILLSLVAAFAIGVVLGGIGVGELRDSRAQREQSTVVSLVALPESGFSGGFNSRGTVLLNGQLTLINTGPAPITIRAAQAERPGVQVRSMGQARQVRPGGTGQIPVELQLECATAFELEPLSVRFSVETEDKRLREARYPVALVGSAWQEDAQRLCEPRLDS